MRFAVFIRCLTVLPYFVILFGTGRSLHERMLWLNELHLVMKTVASARENASRKRSFLDGLAYSLRRRQGRNWARKIRRHLNGGIRAVKSYKAGDTVLGLFVHETKPYPPGTFQYDSAPPIELRSIQIYCQSFRRKFEAEHIRAPQAMHDEILHVIIHEIVHCEESYLQDKDRMLAKMEEGKFLESLRIKGMDV